MRAKVKRTKEKWKKWATFTTYTIQTLKNANALWKWRTNPSSLFNMKYIFLRACVCECVAFRSTQTYIPNDLAANVVSFLYEFGILKRCGF